MLKNYLVTAWRNIIHNKLYSLINIDGLAVGFSATKPALFLGFEKSL